MKTLLSFLMAVFLISASAITAQQLLVGGNMEDASAWQSINYKAEQAEFEFNYLAGGPTEGSGGCLEVTASGTNECDILFYQAVTLYGGDEYEIHGAFKDMSGTIANFWCEILYDLVEPPPADSGDFVGTLILGFNTWNGTPAGIDGTFQDDYAKGNGPVFTAPGNTGESTTVYIAVDVGCWLGGTAYFWDVAIDELSLTPAGSTDVEENLPDIPNQFDLLQNYPNPFNPSTSILYSLPTESAVSLKVFDVMGSEVAVLVNNESKSAGKHKISFDASSGGGLPSGIYFYKLQAGNFTATKKMMLIK